MAPRPDERRPLPPRPTGVRVAIALVALYGVWLLLGAIDTPVNLLFLGVPVLWAVGLARAMPVARWWSLFVTVFHAVFAWTALWPYPENLIRLALALTITAVLSTKASLRYFDLHCIRCGTYRVGLVQANPTIVRCQDCDRRWEPHTDPVDPAVFE